VLAALPEAYALDRCSDHPRIIQLLDIKAASLPKKLIAFVLEDWGVDLRESMRRAPKTPEQVRDILCQVIDGTAHLRKIGLIHADLKPSNILVVEGVAGLQCKISDLGSCVAAAEADRIAPLIGVVLQEGIQLQTLYYRAPEILFGSTTFGVEIDAWSVGIIAAELAGFAFTNEKVTTVVSEAGYMRRLFQQLGTPRCSVLQELPHWPSEPPRFKPAPWPAMVQKCFGTLGIAFLWELLTPTPSQRLQLREAAEHPYLQHDAFVLFVRPDGLEHHPWLHSLPELANRNCHLLEQYFANKGCRGEASGQREQEVPDRRVQEVAGQCRGAGGGSSREQAAASGMDTTFSGKRHSWNLRVGMLSPDVLDWLRRDPAFIPGAAAHEALGLDFSGKHTRRSKIE
jgi:serine/threonine protein kinase